MSRVGSGQTSSKSILGRFGQYPEVSQTQSAFRRPTVNAIVFGEVPDTAVGDHIRDFAGKSPAGDNNCMRNTELIETINAQLREMGELTVTLVRSKSGGAWGYELQMPTRLGQWQTSYNALANGNSATFIGAGLKTALVALQRKIQEMYDSAPEVERRAAKALELATQLANQVTEIIPVPFTVQVTVTYDRRDIDNADFAPKVVEIDRAIDSARIAAAVRERIAARANQVAA